MSFSNCPFCNAPRNMGNLAMQSADQAFANLPPQNMEMQGFNQNYVNLPLQNLPIQVFNQGLMRRDFTYIDDIIQGTIAAIDLGSDCEIFNLGNNRPIDLLYLIQLLEDALGIRAIKEMLPMQLGEVLETCADIEKSKKMLGFEPKTSLEQGILKFIEWYREYHSLKKAEPLIPAARAP